MSDGPRIPLRWAVAEADRLFKAWGEPTGWLVVGSVRRGVGTVGDLEVLLPAAPAAADPVYGRIAATVRRRVRGVPVLFGDDAPGATIVGEELRGLVPGFLAASLSVWPQGGNESDRRVPVQVYRYTPRNLGWTLIMRTGPREFGMHFLLNWKRLYSIAAHRQASVDGHLVDRVGEVVTVATEEEAFTMCGMRFVPPEQRDEYVMRHHQGAMQ